MIWTLWVILAFFIAYYIKVFHDYGSNYFLILSLLFLFFSFHSFVVWLFGWLFLWIAIYEKIQLGIS